MASLPGLTSLRSAKHNSTRIKQSNCSHCGCSYAGRQSGLQRTCIAADTLATSREVEGLSDSQLWHVLILLLHIHRRPLWEKL